MSTNGQRHVKIPKALADYLADTEDVTRGNEPYTSDLATGEARGGGLIMVETYGWIREHAAILADPGTAAEPRERAAARKFLRDHV